VTRLATARRTDETQQEHVRDRVPDGPQSGLPREMSDSGSASTSTFRPTDSAALGLKPGYESASTKWSVPRYLMCSGCTCVVVTAVSNCGKRQPQLQTLRPIVSGCSGNQPQISECPGWSVRARCSSSAMENSSPIVCTESALGGCQSCRPLKTFPGPEQASPRLSY
jgi:hypothetical protein